ncbi:MAG: hypothetical protein UT60_C0024G0012, partial [candidate division CPR2 bacterium GW2011_GWD2_39_7]
MNENPQKILIVEDDLQLVDMYKKKFDLEGFVTEMAGDGEKALEKIQFLQK